jgi:hypothetical protein
MEAEAGPEMDRVVLALFLAAWFAVFRWIPEDQPPARVLFGPFRSAAECKAWASDAAFPPDLRFHSCVFINQEVP